MTATWGISILTCPRLSARFLSPISVLTLLGLLSVCRAEDFSVFRLTEGSHVGAYPQINERGMVAWEGTVTTDPDRWEIYVYDGGGIARLTDNELYDCNVRITDSGWVVWQTLEGPHGHIFVYDGTGTVQITAGEARRILGDVNERGDVVWTECDPLVPGSCEIMLYDGTAVLPLTQNSHDDVEPRINNSGQVVWRSADDPQADIFLFDGIVTTRLTDDSHRDRSPQINDNGLVAWHRLNAPAGFSLLLYDGSDIVEIAGNDVWKTCKLNEGGQVAWSGSEMFFYDGAEVIPIPDYAYWVHPPSYFDINDNDHVVFPSHTGGGRDQIRVWDGADVTFLSDSAYDSDYPDMNNGNQVVWHTFFSFGLLDTEIFLAVPSQCKDDDADGVGNPASPVCPDARWDCDDSNPNIFPGHTNPYCDCEMPHPTGTEEVCSGGIDEDCDGLVDCEDEDCLGAPECALPCGGCLPSAEPSVRGTGAVTRSGALAHATFFVLPAVQIFLLKRLLRKKRPKRALFRGIRPEA